MKRCSACEKEKSLPEFYRNAAMRDGYQNQCKVCHHKSKIRWNENNRGKLRELGRKNKAAQRKRDGVKKTRQMWRAWYASNAEHRKTYQRNHYDPIKRAAQNKLNKAIMYGRIVRPDQCSKCDRRCKPDGHHEDYSKPLEVVWLCRRCHRLTQNKVVPA